MSHNLNTKFWSFAFLVAIVTGICGATLGPHLSMKEFRKIRAAISNLPQHNRLSLERNLDSYQKLSLEEKSRFWNMHRDVEEQNLTPLVEDYKNWLSTISPYDRQVLRTSLDPAAKIAALEVILKKQRLVNEQRLPELIARIIERKVEQAGHGPDSKDSTYRMLRFFFSNQSALNFKGQYVFSASQLETLTEEILLPQLSTSQQREFDDEKIIGIERMMKIVRSSITHTNNPRQNWPSAVTFELLKEAGMLLEFNSSDQNKKGGNPSRPSPEAMGSQRSEFYKRIAFRRMLVRSLMVSEMQQFEKKNPVRDNELLSFFNKSDSSKQAALLDSPADYQADALKWLYIWETEKYRNQSIFSNPDFIKSVLREMLPQGGNPNGNRPNRPPNRDKERFRPGADNKQGKGPGGFKGRPGRSNDAPSK